MTTKIYFIKSIPEEIKELARVYDFKANYEEFLYDQASCSLYIGTNYVTNPINCSDFDKVLYYQLGQLTKKEYPSTTNQVTIDPNNLTEKELSSFKLGLVDSQYSYNYTKGIIIKPLTILPELNNREKALQEGIYLTKELMDLDSYKLNPSNYDTILKEKFQNLPTWVTIKVVEQEVIEELGMNMLLAVARGSKHGCKIIIVDITPKSQEYETIAMVGKGLCFDTGGVNIKEGGSSYGMHDDMGGSATVFGLAKTLSLLDQPENKRIVFVAGIVENVTDGKAYHPGEIVSNMVGQTAIVKNTDAEGRLTLADTIPYTIINYKPKVIISLATLTGHALLAFTQNSAPIFATKQALRDNLYQYFLQNEEEAVSMTLPRKAYDIGIKDLTGKADMINTVGFPAFAGKGQAGSQAAAAFVMSSSQPQLWNKNQEDLALTTDAIHIDIAGTAVDSKGFGTGYAIRSLLDYCLNS